MNMYDQSPQFGFTGSNLPGLPTTLDDVNPAYYNQIAGFLAAKYGAPANARLASITGVVLYDTLRIDLGVLPTRDFVFFQNQIGAQQGLFVAGTQYSKQDIDVHQWITNGGQLAKGYEALVWSIGVQFHIPAAKDATLQTTGNAINLTLDPGAVPTEVVTDLSRAGNVIRAFQEGLYFELFVNQTTFESGPGWRFPAGPYGVDGFLAMASAATAPAFMQGDGYVNNGWGWAYQMPIMRHIPSLTKFGIRMKVQNPFTTANVQTVRVVVTLEGIGIQPVTG